MNEEGKYMTFSVGFYLSFKKKRFDKHQKKNSKGQDRMHFVHVWAILIVFVFHNSIVTGRVFFVDTYGAYPDDGIDDTKAVQTAINMAIKDGSNNDVIFGAGTYTLSAAIGITEAVNLTVRGQGMSETLLLGTVPTSIFEPYSCQQLTITGLAIDFDPLPFTAGYVVNTANDYVDLRIQAPHQPDVGRHVGAILRYNVALMRPAFGNDTYEQYYQPALNATTSLVSPGVLRIPVRPNSKFNVGDALVVRYVFQNHAITGQDNTDLTIRSVTTYTSWCMSFVTSRSRGLNILDYHVLRKGDRWMSSIVDCMHFSDTRDYINIFDSECQSMGDDGLNVHATYLPVIDIINATALVIQSFHSADKLNFGLGTHLEFSTHQQPFTPYTKAAIVSTAIAPNDSRVFVFDRSINAKVTDFAIVADTANLTIRNFTVANNRARGVLLETRNIHLSQSTFHATSGAAVYFQPSMFWSEGPTARNVTLDHNRYIDCNQGIAKQNGVILFLSDPVQLVPVVSDVQITASTFIMGPFSDGILQVDNGENVSLSGNYIETNSSTPLIYVCNSRNISASNNSVVNKQSTIDKYYVYDSRNPCNSSLSSLIDLPPSAFNSTFGPPVIEKRFFSK